MRHQNRGDHWQIGSWVLMLATVFALACAPAVPPTPTPAPAPPKPAAPAAAPTAAPKPAAPAVAAKPKALAKLRIAVVEPNWGQVFKTMAAEKDFYREEGLDAEMTTANEPSRLNGLIAGQFDAGSGIAVAGLAAMEKGADLVFVANENYPNDLLFVRPSINKVEDLVGKKIGINTIGSQTHQLFVELFNKYKIDPQKATYVQVGNDSARMAALISGQLDATTASVGNLEKAEQAGLRSLLAFGQELTSFASTPTVVQGKLVREKPELVEAFLTAMARGIRYGIEHPDESATVGMKLLKETDREVAVKTINNLIRIRTASPNLNLTPEQLNLMQDQNIQSGQQKARLPLEKIANFDIGKRVNAKLGRYPGWN